MEKIIKFSINITNEKEVKNFLRQGDLDFIVIVALQGKAFMICDSTEIYTHLSFDILSRQNLNDSVIFRLHRQNLIGLLSNGIIEFTVDGDLVSVKFLTNSYEPRYGFKCKYQTDLISTFLRRLEILEESDEYRLIDLAQIQTLTRFAKSLNTNVICCGNTACVRLKTLSVYKDVDNLTFTCFGKTLALLSTYTTKVYDVQNYLVYKGDDKAIIITKRRDMFDSELEFIKHKPVHYEAKFSLANIIDITKRVNFGDGRFYIDFNNKVARYKEESTEYDISIEVSDAIDIKKKKHESNELNLDSLDFAKMFDNVNTSVNTDIAITKLPSIMLPSEALKSILVHLGTNSIILTEIKKDFVIFRTNGLYIVFGRRDYVDM